MTFGRLSVGVGEDSTHQKPASPQLIRHFLWIAHTDPSSVSVDEHFSTPGRPFLHIMRYTWDLPPPVRQAAVCMAIITAANSSK